MAGAKTSIQKRVYGGFLGADFSTDASLVDVRRSPLCTNIIADSGGMPQKRSGWRVLHRLGTRINGIHTASFAGVTRRLVHAGESIYLWSEDGEPTLLLSGVPDKKSRSVFLKGKLWLVTGGDYLSYDGTTLRRVAGSADAYVPTTVITRMPAGGGVPYEDVNMLTPRRKNAFQTDGEATEFTLDGTVDASGTVRAWVWGEETTAFTVDRTNGVVTFSTAPAAPEAGSADGLVIEFPHTVEGYADRIGKCTVITTYGSGSNDRVIVSGNPEMKNVDWISGFEDPTYFPDLGYAVVGSEAAAIVGYLRVGSQLAIVKRDDGHDSTVYLRSAATDENGDTVFPVFPAIAGVGGIAEGSFASLLDDPLYLTRTGVAAITTQTMTSEKLTQRRSWFVDPRLTEEERLPEAEAVVWNGLYILALPNGHAYVLDARAQKSYRSASLGDFVYECFYWENVPARCWGSVRLGEEEALYFGTNDGRLCKMNTDLETMERYSDDGQAIDAVWATKYDDDGTPAVLKTVLKRGCSVTVKPFSRSSGTVYYRTDKTDGAEKKTAQKDMALMLNFADVDFEDFTFNTDDSPQEIFLNRKIKNYKRLQIIVRNREVNEGFGVFGITKHYVVGNFAKK